MKQEKKKGVFSTWVKKYFGTTESNSIKSNSQRSKSTNYLPPILAPDTQDLNNNGNIETYQKDSIGKASNTNTVKSKSSSKSLVFREKPPRQPMSIPQQTITIPGKLLPPPPREVIIEQEEYDDDGPQEIIIERWLAYPKQQRKVIFETPHASGRPEDYQMVTVADDDTLKNHLKRLGMSEVDLQKIDWESFDSHNNLDPQSKRNIIYQSAPSIQPAQVQAPQNIFIDWEYDQQGYQHTHYAEEPIDVGGTSVSSERRMNGGNFYESYAKSMSNINTANVKFLGIEEVDPYEYVQKHSTELIDSSNLPDYFKTLQLPANLVGEKVELAADKANDRFSVDFTGDVAALDLVTDKNLYKF